MENLSKPDYTKISKSLVLDVIIEKMIDNKYAARNYERSYDYHCGYEQALRDLSDIVNRMT